MLMWVRMAPPLPLIFFLLMIHGVSSAGWSVSYSPSHICALKDSTVIMRCTYKYPTTGYKIKEVFWTKTLVQDNGELPDLSNDTEYSQRLQYLGDKQQNCTVRLSHVTLKDSHMYYFRFITDKPDGKWTGAAGVNLTVTGLQVESPERVTEGDSVTLRCKSSCALPDRATFIWSRNSQPLTERRDRNNELLLQSVRREDSGRYSCAVDGHTHISPEVQLNVTYPPVKPVISISPSGVIVEGDSVTLNCISDSNPPAEISWFKGGTIVGSGRIYNISKINSNYSGEYKCKSINEHGEKYSDNVTLNVMFHHVAGRNLIVITAASGGLVFIIIFIIIFILFIMKKQRNVKAEDLTVKENDLCSDASQSLSVHDKPLSEPDSANDALYASVKPQKIRGKTPESRDTEEIQYATVQHHRKTETKRAEENECQYEDIRVHQPDAAVRRSTVQIVEDSSVIYSSVK